jgi:hypothetical protein
VADEFRHLHMPPDLACEFFAVFSRMEYALKATGTYAMDGGKGKAAANWDTFANAIDDKVRALADQRAKAAMDYLLSKPPRKQLYDNGTVRFQDQEIDPRQAPTQQALLMVRTVRNNLFHGGKHIAGDEREPGRNEALVTHCVALLKACVLLDESVRVNYEH